MRIVISGMFWMEPHVGSGQYLHNLIAQFAQIGGRHKIVLVLPRYTQPTKPQLRGIQTVIMPTPFDHRNQNLAKVWFEQIALLQVAHKVRAERLHVPYFGPPRRTRLPLVVSILDLIPLLLPPYRGGRAVQTYMRLATVGARRAPHMIAISEHTKQDIMEHFGTPSGRVTVTPLAAGPHMFPQPSEVVAATLERFRLTQPYIFYIGGFDVRKNLPLLIRAFARLRRITEEPLQLVLAGRPAGTDPNLFPDIHRIILDAGVAPHVVLLGPVSEGEKAALMTGCTAFAFPSQYEGFGLNPVEAMQCGAPVVAASTTSVGEVVADGGLLVDPDDEAAWTEALREVVLNRELADDLRRRGLARARHFDWQTTAQRTLEVYDHML